MAGFLNWLKGSKADKFKAGQLWKYKTRLGEENSTVMILKVEKYENAETIIHISISGVKINNKHSPNGITEVLGHSPLSEEAVLKSVTQLIASDQELPDYYEGYNKWKEAFDNKKAGVFGLDICDVVKVIDETVNMGNRVEE